MAKKPKQAGESDNTTDTPPPKKSKWSWYTRHKKLSIPLTVVLALLVLSGIIYAVPAARYGVLSHFVQRSYVVTVTDMQGDVPLQDAKVQLGDQTVSTNTDGEASLADVRVGYHKMTITKELYDTVDHDVEVPVFGDSRTSTQLHANGKRVVVTVKDRLSGKVLDGVEITAGKSKASTNSDGQAQVVVPTNTTSLDASVHRDGYLTQAIQLTQEPREVALVKSGRMFFLSKQSGTIDVVSTNLDGSDRKTAVKGTGSEDERETSLLASRDWKYLALTARRDSAQPRVYLIDTQNPEPVRVTDGATLITPVGWSGQRFVYKETNPSDSASWSLKSVRATDKAVVTLEKAETVPAQSGESAYQFIDTPYILEGDTIVYAIDWSQPFGGKPQGRQSGVVAVQTDGSNRRFLKSYPAQEISYIQTKLYKPQEIHYRVFNSNYERRENIMTVNKKIEIVPPEQQKFDQDYPTFLISPDGKRAFWAESRDGKFALFVGDNNSGNQQQLANLVEYTAYGWLTDDYLLLQRGDSELFITTPEQLKADGEPLKISDYHKPSVSFAGYGYGYGGQ